jgi:hypothetical protein
MVRDGRSGQINVLVTATLYPTGIQDGLLLQGTGKPEKSSPARKNGVHSSLRIEGK